MIHGRIEAQVLIEANDEAEFHQTVADVIESLRGYATLDGDVVVTRQQPNGEYV